MDDAVLAGIVFIVALGIMLAVVLKILARVNLDGGSNSGPSFPLPGVYSEILDRPARSKPAP